MTPRLFLRAPFSRSTTIRSACRPFAIIIVAATMLLSYLLSAATSAGAVPLRDQSPFGVYVPDLPGGQTDLPNLQELLGAHMEIASSFTDWSYIFGGPNDHWQAANNTRRVLYSWEPFGFRFNAVTNGQKDGYLQRVADSMKLYPWDIYVRPWGEMNANWSSWQPTPGGEKPYGGTPAEFIDAWRHMVDFFHSRGVYNLKFMFNPDAADFSNNTPIPSIWPGSEYVDVIGIDGYNWGYNAATGDTWRDFDLIMEDMYGILTGLHSTAPVWIAEYGSKEPLVNDGAPADPGNSKGVWMANMMMTQRFPRINGLAYFNVKKERDWRIESSPASVNAMRQQLAARQATPPAV
jgi:hypothetical protein